jgi:cytochrome P450/NADPH-cytochrome P450 reductase
VLGKRPIAPSDIKNLKYLNACLRESLRLSPTATAMSKQINPLSQQEFALLDGRYKVDPSDRVLVLLGKTQRDVSVYGEDAAEFHPERMLDENFNKLPSGAWKPFGNGIRGCIGRPFAWQEALMVAALVLQHFDLELDDPAYELKIKQTLTIKPKNLYVRAKARDGIDATLLDQQLHSNAPNGKAHSPQNGDHKPTTGATDERAPMTILYGSNTGTCLALAQRLSSHAAARGFDAKVLDMDSAVERVPQTQPIIIITSSYEGQPPDDAGEFMAWLQDAKRGQLSGVRFAVFGCGHRDWAKTFHAVPKLANKLMADAGAHRIAPIGFSDVADGNVFGDFEDWEDEVLWPQLSSNTKDLDHHDNPITAEISTDKRASSLRYDVFVGTVKSNKTLTADGEPVKRHMEVQLQTLSEYECGDYLAILPLNSEKSVQRVMTHFKLPFDAVITFKGNETGSSAIPNNTPLSIYDLLRSYVELSQPATKGALKICARYTESPKDKTYLEETALDSNLFRIEIINKRVSVFDILLHTPSISLPLPTFLGLLPPLRVRQYSISSSPLVSPETCTITYGNIHQPALSDPDILFEGVASSYLSSLKMGDRIQVSLRKTSKKTFRVPDDTQNTPMLMFAAGTGLAPFRGFIEQRAALISANPEIKLAKAVLFLGCRSMTKDRLYAEEMDQWIRDGVVDVRYAFSREPENSQGCKYVPERMKCDKDLLRQLWKDGATVYVCGSREFDRAVGEAARAVAVEKRMEDGMGKKEEAEKQVEEWFAGVASQRIATDIFD